MSSLKRAWAGAKATASTVIAKAKSALAWFYKQPVGKALKRFGDRNGNILAGGIAYASITSIAAGVVLVISVTSLVVMGNESYRYAVLEFIGSAVPGLFPDGDQPGLLDPEAIRPTAVTGLVGVGALIVLARAAMRYLGALRAGVRAMLGVAEGTGVPGILRDVLAMLGLGLVALLGAGLQVVAGSLARTVAGALGEGGVSEALVRGTAFSVGVAVNAAFVALAYLVLGRAHVRRKVLLWTVLATAVAIAVLQQATNYFVGSATNNPLLASFAAIIALLVFVDLVARVIMLGAAWLGVVAQPRAVVRDGENITVVEDQIRPRRRNHITTRRAMRRERP